jgi:hypothetical protein
MKTLSLIIALLMPLACLGQSPTIVTWDSRHQPSPPTLSEKSEITLINLAATDAGKEYFAIPTPALWRDGFGVAITSTIPQAKTDVRRMAKDAQPPEIKAANKMYRQARKQLLAREGTPVAGTNAVPNIEPADFLVRAGSLTNAPTTAQLYDLFKGVAAIQILSAQAAPQLSEENSQ